MESSLGPTSANIFLCFHEKKWPTKLPCRSLNQYILGDMLAIFLFYLSQEHLAEFFLLLKYLPPWYVFFMPTRKK